MRRDAEMVWGFLDSALRGGSTGRAVEREKGGWGEELLRGGHGQESKEGGSEVKPPQLVAAVFGWVAYGSAWFLR